MQRAAIYFAVIIILATFPIINSKEYIVGDYVPSDLLDDYWAFYGAPFLDAKIIGSNHVDRGANVTLFVNLANSGGRINYESTKIVATPLQKALAVAEAAMEWDVGNALGITATLRSTSDLIEVKSADQVIDSLKSIEKSDPMEFVIQINDHAPAGQYILNLDLYYEYQDNVQVAAEGLDPDLGLQEFKVARYHKSANQSIPLIIVVEPAADFDIIQSGAEMSTGQKGLIEVKYKNIGEEPADNAIARISIFKPFASARDQSYIGSIEPGQEKNATFEVDVDEDAISKNYSINSEIKYTDIDGNSMISDSMKIPVAVSSAGPSYTLPALILLILLLAGGYTLKRKKA